MYQSVLKI